MTLAKDANMKELNRVTSNFIEEFHDKETRHIYADDFLNTKIATQIKVLREQRGWTQAELAKKTEMAQARISLLEDVNYESWTISVLRRLAAAFDLRIDLEFKDFGSFLKDFTNFNRDSLERKSFNDDPTFNEKTNNTSKITDINKNRKEHKDMTVGRITKSIRNSTPAIFQPELIGLGLTLASNSTQVNIKNNNENAGTESVSSYKYQTASTKAA